MSYFPPHASAEYGLSRQDFLDLTVLATTLGADWTVIIECGDGADSYARLAAPWNGPCASAFLIEREADAVTVTDRLSNMTDDVVTAHPGMGEAIDTIRRTIGTLATRPATGPTETVERAVAVEPRA